MGVALKSHPNVKVDASRSQTRFHEGTVAPDIIASCTVALYFQPYNSTIFSEV
jgi:hypothetical protein